MNRARYRPRTSSRTKRRSRAISTSLVKGRAGPNMKHSSSTNRCWCEQKRIRQRASAMQNAARIMIVALSAAALPACHKAQPQPNQAVAVDDNVAAGQLPPGADIETLPPDESSVTSNGELAKGDDNPDVNDL